MSSDVHAKKILVVDDDPSLRAIIVSILESDYQMTEASCCDEALRIFRQDPADLAILDFNLPVTSGGRRVSPTSRNEA